MSLAVVIVAAGRGVRAAADGAPFAKQYRPLAGKPLLLHSIMRFANRPAPPLLAVVIGSGDERTYAAATAPYADRLLPPVIGGETRQDSVRHGLEALAPHGPEHVLIHDAARPFPDPALIDRVIRGLEAHPAVLPALPVSDTLKHGDNGIVRETVSRSGLWRAQTPQAFHFAPILAAHRAAAEAGREDFTDDAAIAEWAGLEVALVEGSEANVKITTAEDFRLAEQRLAAERGASLLRVCVGSGFDVHAFGPGDGVTLCGVRVPHDRSLIGHSDADVALHALTDAILGALGEGDIGVHFPPAEPQWAGVASELFLRDALYRVHDRGGSIDHVDVTIVCEEPRVTPYRDAMRESVAAILGLDLVQVGLKATTSERLGFTGRGEGIAAMATATLRLP